MAKLPPEEIERIVEEELPGYTVERPGPPADAPGRYEEADEASPGIDELRKRYGVEPDDVEGHANPDPQPDAGEAEDADDEIVAVRPKDPKDPWDHDARPKSVVISGKDRKIVGGQG
jgi:hypothetical protein